MILKVLTYPDPRLREKALPVEVFDRTLSELAANMLETMYSEQGIGLAATQVGELRRMLVIDCRPKDEKGRYDLQQGSDLEAQVEQPLVLINPRIVKGEGKTTFDEGCLSVPSFFETVERIKTIEVEYQDLSGKIKKLKTDGLLSIVIQHEMDHLEGTLFIDHLSLIKSNKIKNQIKKSGYPEKKSRGRDKATLENSSDSDDFKGRGSSSERELEKVLLRSSVKDSVQGSMIGEPSSMGDLKRKKEGSRE